MRSRAASIIRASALAAVVFICTPRDALAQSSGFLTRAEYYVSFAGIAAPDPRFSSQARMGLESDLVDFGSGRVTFKAEYEAFIGSERRQWDLNQGTYRFDTAVSRRIGATEVSGILLHVSRHLVDRDNPPSIAWNAVGVRARHRWTMGRDATIVEGRVDVTHAMQQAVVDYLWGGDLRLSVRHPPASWRRVSLLADASGTLMRTKLEKYGRPGICGARIEGGVRINGERAALEAFLGYERRLDAFPTDRFRVRMWTFGFRLVSK